MTAPPLPPLPDAVRDALPASTPAPPWPCRVEAVVWWHRSVPDADGALPPAARPGLPVTVGAFLRYLETPVGPYDEVLAAPRLLRGGLVLVNVPFIAVDSVPSIAGGRAHWQLPKVPAVFRREAAGVEAEGDGWRVRAQARPRGPALPVAARFGSTQDGRAVARSSVRGRARLARVEVDGAGLPPWLRAGSHPGAVLTGARLVVGAAR